MLLQDFQPAILPWRPQIVFSAFAIHHLGDDDKRKVYEQIYRCLESDGIFILFDSFRPREEQADRLLEYLCCLDIKRRAENARSRPLDIERVIARDRENKCNEGDREASLPDQLAWLHEIGFRNVTTIFQESRYAGLVAFGK